MEFKDYYKIMGISPKATQDEIKRAYRKLARKYHPDVSKEPDAETRFKELGEAYEALKDPEKRAQYDTLKEQGWRPGEDFNARSQQQHGFYSEHVNPEDVGAYSDFFEAIFGQQARPDGWHRRGGSRRGPTRGEDVRYILEVDPEDSYHSSTKKIEIPIVEEQNGRLVRKHRTINVKIPKGVINGQQIRLKGQGSPGSNNAPAGDLYLEIHLKQREPFHVEGRDVTLYLPVAPWEAALGAKVKVPTLGGPIELKIPPNAQTGSKLRLKDRGLPGNPPGDQYVVLQIVIPSTTTESARELYQQMAEKISFNPREKLGV